MVHAVKCPQIIYTAIFGDRDKLLREPHVPEDVSYICFTDNPNLQRDSNTVWQIEICQPKHPDPCRAAKRYKLFSHFALPKHKLSIWVDGSFEIIKPLFPLFCQMRNCDLGLFDHPFNYQTCIYKEGAVCSYKGYDTKETILLALERYTFGWEHPENAGLPMGNAILRRNTPAVAEFNRAWWKEVCTGTRRDQISLMPVLRRLKIPFHLFERNLLYNGGKPCRNKPHNLCRNHPHST